MEHLLACSDPAPLVTDEDIQNWGADAGLTRSQIYDQVAIHLARRFHRGELDFAFCDEIVNTIHGIIIHADEARPDLFWCVFLAFDAGESYPNNDRSIDPIETFTRPLIAEVVERSSSEYPDV